MINEAYEYVKFQHMKSKRNLGCDLEMILKNDFNATCSKEDDYGKSFYLKTDDKETTIEVYLRDDETDIFANVHVWKNGNLHPLDRNSIIYTLPQTVRAIVMYLEMIKAQVEQREFQPKITNI